jgi:predicted flap endonuclease-1-like 5' DNA nuclease
VEVAPEVSRVSSEIVKEVSSVKEDDLKIIEGVGPKIESLLKESGMKTLEAVSNATADQIRDILRDKGGERYAFHDPST